jgi:hypothetical protein
LHTCTNLYKSESSALGGFQDSYASTRYYQYFKGTYSSSTDLQNPNTTLYLDVYTYTSSCTLSNKVGGIAHIAYSTVCVPFDYYYQKSYYGTEIAHNNAGSAKL